jgi:hypothetical protein
VEQLLSKPHRQHGSQIYLVNHIPFMIAGKDRSFDFFGNTLLEHGPRMMKKSRKKKSPPHIKQYPNQGEVLPGLHQLFIRLLRTELNTALVLAHLSHNPMHQGFRERAKEKASQICIAILIQLSEARISTQDRLWVDEKLKEIDQWLGKAYEGTAQN